MSVFNRRHVLPRMQQCLAALNADIVCLQEVQGMHRKRAQRFADWPTTPQHIALADGAHHAYGQNASYRSGHHGNALLSRFPIVSSCNIDISVSRLERRGLLHCQIAIPGTARPLDVLCIHLNLRAPDRRKQLEAVANYIHKEIGDTAPLVLAGDFNDWRAEACDNLGSNAGLVDAFRRCHGHVALTFPARLPLLPLDRIYVRGLIVEHAMLHRNDPWRRLSDHIPMSVTVRWSDHAGPLVPSAT